MGLHDPDLDRRGLGPQDPAVGEVKGVLLVPGGMVRGSVQGVEIMVDVLHFRSGNGHEAHAAENGHAFVGDLHDGMFAPHGTAASGKRGVDGAFTAALGEAGVALVDELLNLPAARVEGRPRFPSLLRGNGAHFPRKSRKEPVAAEKFDTHRLDIRRGGGGGALFRRTLDGGIDFFDHRIHCIIPS